jgi:hypothetical protein
MQPVPFARFHFARLVMAMCAIVLFLVVWSAPSFAVEPVSQAWDTSAGEMVIAVFIGVIALGIFLGMTGRAVVFRNYDDLALVFACAVTMFLALILRQTQILLFIDLLVGAGLMLAIVMRT